MQTHPDENHESRKIREAFAGLGLPARPSPFDGRLRERAQQHREDGESQITGGAPGEQPLKEWRGARNVSICKWPADEQSILRISVGGGVSFAPGADYLTYRGNRRKCIALLERALADLKDGDGG